MTVLGPSDLDQLSKSLTGALDFFQLDRMVYLGTGDRLFEAYVGPGDPLRPTIQKLLLALEKDATTDRFLRVVYREKPLQTTLRSLIARLYPEIARDGAAEPPLFDIQKGGVRDGEESQGPGLQRNVRPSLPSPDLRIWLDKVERIERQVCRVEARGLGIGTGFLIANGVVLTNWHVAEEARRRGALGDLLCRFDYKKLTGGGVEAGQTFAVTAVIDERPCSPAELGANPDTPPPAPDELDYAMLQLAASTAGRGVVALAEPPPVAADSALIIVQHPDGEPLRFALDTQAVIGLVNNDMRLRYRTNTAAGSSGSPCFDMELNLIALHHLGDPNRLPATFNQGVPIGLIRRSIAARGHAALLA